MDKTKQSFEYTGSSQYTIDNTILSSSGIALFDTASGVGGVDYMPYDGSDVTVKAGDIYGDYRELAPTLNNKLYYLVSDTLYDSSQKTLILSLATEIPVYFNGTEFEGTFVFSNPNNYPYIYLLWDYEDKMDSIASYKGETSSRSIGFDLGSRIGRAGISFNSMDPDQPTRFQVEWNGSIIRDSLYVGVNSISNYNALIAAGIPEDEIGLVFPYDGLVNNGIGSLEFFKNTPEPTANLIVSSPFTGSLWIVNKIDTHLTEFYLDTADGIPSDVCTQCPIDALYHNGANDLPIVGDIVFLSSDGYDVYSNPNTLHMIDSVACSSPSPTDKTYIEVDDNGLVLSVSPCNCSEYAVPFIFENPITVTSNSQSFEVIDVLNNPTSWARR